MLETKYAPAQQYFRVRENAMQSILFGPIVIHKPEVWLTSKILPQPHCFFNCKFIASVANKMRKWNMRVSRRHCSDSKERKLVDIRAMRAVQCKSPLILASFHQNIVH